MAFFPRFAAGEFAPLFHLLDDYDVHRSSRPTNQYQFTPVRSFAPKFDVYELRDGYHLDGELPGVDQHNIDIEFTDPHTLVIKGRVEREYRDVSPAETHETEDAVNSTPSSPSVKSLQPTVEDESEEGNTTAADTPTKPADKQVRKSDPRPAHKYWVSERSVGEFHRTFTFPTRVDQEAVKASLKNGILSIVIPKASAPKVKKITIE